MGVLIQKVFDFLAIYFDKIPVLNKIKGLRSILGFIGLAVVAVLQNYNIGDPELMNSLHLGFLVWTGLSLNAKQNAN